MCVSWLPVLGRETTLLRVSRPSFAWAGILETRVSVRVHASTVPLFIFGRSQAQMNRCASLDLLRNSLNSNVFTAF